MMACMPFGASKILGGLIPLTILLPLAAYRSAPKVVSYRSILAMTIVR